MSRLTMPDALAALWRAARAGDEAAAWAALDWLKEDGDGLLGERLGEEAAALRGSAPPSEWARDVARRVAEHFKALATYRALAGIRPEDVPVMTTEESLRQGHLAQRARALFELLGLLYIEVGTVMYAYGKVVVLRVPRCGDYGRFAGPGGDLAPLAHQEAVAAVRAIIARAFPGYADPGGLPPHSPDARWSIH